MKNAFFIFLTVIVFISCNKDNDETTVAAIDFITTIDENPTEGQIIGSVEGTTNNGSVTFSISTQSPGNSFEINSSTGQLSVVDVSQFDYELNTIITGTVKVANGDVYKDVNITINVLDIEEGNVFTGDVHLHSQQEVDSFGAENYTKITGRLVIGEWYTLTDISDLTPLNALAIIENRLDIINSPLLESLDGLNNIVIVRGDIEIDNNDGLTSLRALENLTKIIWSLSIRDNDSLEYINGFNNLQSIGGVFNVRYNNNLKEIKGFNNLEHIERDLNIFGNDELTEIIGFESLSRVNRYFSIGYNNTLTFISDFNNLSVGTIRVNNNDSLNYLNWLGNVDCTGSVEIVDNDSIISLDGLENVPATCVHRITDNPILEDFCTLQSSERIYTFYVWNNLYNPSSTDILNGNCVP